MPDDQLVDELARRLMDVDRIIAHHEIDLNAEDADCGGYSFAGPPCGTCKGCEGMRWETYAQREWPSYRVKARARLTAVGQPGPSQCCPTCRRGLPEQAGRPPMDGRALREAARLPEEGHPMAEQPAEEPPVGDRDLTAVELAELDRQTRCTCQTNDEVVSVMCRWHGAGVTTIKTGDEL